MPSQRDWDQMLKEALELKARAQKFIDFAKMYGAGEGGEGEEDLEEQEDDESPQGEPSEDKGLSINRNPKAAMLLAISKSKKKK